ncbi:hypothetical protein [Aquimarina pacifica]|uniref:hypothetical protein n=1 Tax=Aquimarina pacifica TaxID=1296415 RepID=UPI0004703C28|nr:hypothetical protein [Aquimarina pacifica]
MKSLLTTLTFFLFFSSIITAQSIYESGYFIDNNGKRKECLIKKLPWKNNPTEFEWKKTISSSPRKEKIEDIKEFGVGRDYFFKRFIMEFDLQGDDVGISTKSKDPRLKIRKVFLRTILKSEATLYQYSENDVHRFFYTNKTTAYPKLLVFKTYYVPDTTKKVGEKIITKENTTYKDQLKEHINCGNQDVSTVEHTEKDLKNYFKEFNECRGAKIEYILKKKISQTKIGLIASLDMVNFSHPSGVSTNPTTIYDEVMAPKYGIFLETFIPFSKVGLSFFLESTYRQFTTTQNNAFPTVEPAVLDFKSVNVAVAPRFHIYLSSKFEVFFEGGLSVDHDIGTESIFENIEKTTLDYFYGSGLGIGRFKVGYRIYTDKNIVKTENLTDELSESTLSTTSIYLSINLSRYNR